jgi:hypothetical protein
MILVLASQSDDAARSLVERWSSHDARLLVPEDMSMVGWRHRPCALSSSRGVVGGIVVPLAELRGVLVRVPSVTPSDLPHIRGEDRAYVAAEMTAFLMAWLPSLPCPVLNRPTPTSLAGPSFRPEQWVHAAASAGVPVAAMRRTIGGYAPPLHPPESTSTVVVVGDACLGAPSAAVADRAREVARRAQVSLLNTYFAGPPDAPVFVGADVWVSLGDPTVTDAVLALLQSGQARCREVVS